MSQRQRLWCLFPIVCFFFEEFVCVKILPEYILQEGKSGNCDENIVNTPSVLLRSHVGAGLFGGLNSYQADQECAVTFQTENGHKILVQFPFFELPPPDGDNCTDKVVFTEKGTGSTTETVICTKQDFTSETEKIEVKFISDSSNEKRGFEAIVTSFHDGVCTNSEFKCDTTRCISTDLKCDGHDHCIDETDESNESAGCSIFDDAVKTVTALGKYGILAIAIVVGGVLFTIFISVILWKYLKKDGKCCECSDSDDDSDSELDSKERGHMATKSTKITAGSSEKGSMQKFVKEDRKAAKKVKVKGKPESDI